MNPHTRRPRRATPLPRRLAAVTGLLLALSACGGSPSSPATATATTAAAAPAASNAELTALLDNLSRDERHYVGRATGSQAYVALVVAGSEVQGYLCDGQGVSAWFTGTLDGSKVTATGAAGATLTATLDGTTLTGTASLSGQDLPFTTTAATGPAGLYEALTGSSDDPTQVTHKGWIVLPDGTQRGGSTKGGVATAATAEVDPATGTTTDGDDVTTPPADTTPDATDGTFLQRCQEIKKIYDDQVSDLSSPVQTNDDRIKRNVTMTIIRASMRKWNNTKCGNVYGSITDPKFP